MPSPLEIFAVRVAQEGVPVGDNVYAISPERAGLLIDLGEEYGADYVEEGADQYLEFESGEVVELLPRQLRDPRFRLKLPESLDIDRLFRDGIVHRDTGAELGAPASSPLTRQLMIGGLAFVAIAALAVGGYFIWKKLNQPTKEPQNADRNTGAPVGTSGP